MARRTRGVHEYGSSGGERRMAASAPIAGTPWAVWVDYPLDAMVAPAREFVGRMALFSLVVVVALGLESQALGPLAGDNQLPGRELAAAADDRRQAV